MVRLDDDHIVYASSDTTLRVWDASTGTSIKTLEGHQGGVNSVVRLDADRIVSASDDGTLSVWELSTGICLQTLEGHLNIVTSVVRLDNDRIVSASDDKTLRVWEPSTGTELAPLYADAAIGETLPVQVAPPVFAVGFASGYIGIFDLVESRG